MNHPALKPEQTELLRIMKAYIRSEQGYELPPDFSAYAQLFSLSLIQKVAPVAWHYLSSDRNALRNCPANTAAFWKACSDQESASQAQRESVFLDMYQVLREGGLHPLVLKGAVCRQLYAFPNLRPSCDEDLLLQREELEELDILIRVCGFIRDEHQDHEISYTEPESAMHVEIHLEPFRTYRSFNRRQNAEFLDVFGHAEELDISGTKVLTPEPTKHLLFLILHHLQHFSSKGVGIRMLCDIVAFTEKYAEQIDREYLSRTLRKLNLERYFGALEAIGHRYLGLSAENIIFAESTDCEEDLGDLLEDMFTAGVHGTVSHTRVQSSRITSAALDDSSGQGTVRKNLLFPAPERMYEKYRWMKDRAILLPAAYAMRFAGAVRSTVRGRLRGSGEDADSEWVALGYRRLDLLRKYGILGAASAEKNNAGGDSSG